ncbi:hypothetical protein C7S14_7553 [Burkholderia cepacia]|nr:hypothetical protein C7S14_7553 [Burkholderia cepacia]
MKLQLPEAFHTVRVTCRTHLNSVHDGTPRKISYQFSLPQRNIQSIKYRRDIFQMNIHIFKNQSFHF